MALLSTAVRGPLLPLPLCLSLLVGWGAPAVADSPYDNPTNVYLREQASRQQADRDLESLRANNRRPNNPSIGATGGRLSDAELKEAGVSLCRMFCGSDCDGSAARAKVEQRQRDAAAAEDAERERLGEQRSQERREYVAYARNAAANMAANLREGERTGNADLICENVELYWIGSDFGKTDSTQAQEWLDKGLALDAENSTCLDYYGRFITRLRDGKFGMSQHRMAGSQYFAPREVAADVFAANLGYREKARAEAAKVENAFSGARRLPVDAELPYREFAALQSASEQPSAKPEALYWRGRVHGLGQLGQPVDLAIAHDWSCRAAKSGYLRGQVDCLLSLPSLEAQFVPENLLMIQSVVDQNTDSPAAARAAMAYARRLDGVSKQLREGDIAADALPAEVRRLFGSDDKLLPGLTSKICRLLERAYSEGSYTNSETELRMIQCYADGSGVARYPQRARRMFASLIANGHPLALSLQAKSGGQTSE